MTDATVGETVQPERPAIKQCPNCGATIFQGPFFRGEIGMDGTMVTVRETVFQCMGCNAIKGLHELNNH